MAWFARWSPPGTRAGARSVERIDPPSSFARRWPGALAGPAKTYTDLDRRERGASHRDRFVRLCEIASPTGSEREVADAVAARSCAELGVEVARGRRRRGRAGRRGQPDRPHPGSGRGLGLVLRPHGHGSPRRADRGRRGERRLPQRRRHDPRRRQQGRRGGADGAGGPPRRRPARRPGWSWSSPPPRRTGCAARRRSTSIGAALAVRVRDRPRHADRRGDRRRADPQAAGRRPSAGQSAHAGIRPEDGTNAIAAAAAAVAAMELGRLDDETTANVGVIEGGTASNVVAGQLRRDRARRAVDRRRARRGGRWARWSTPAPRRRPRAAATSTSR